MPTKPGESALPCEASCKLRCAFFPRQYGQQIVIVPLSFRKKSPVTLNVISEFREVERAMLVKPSLDAGRALPRSTCGISSPTWGPNRAELHKGRGATGRWGLGIWSIPFL
jgi:hypothetical protein